MGEVLYVGGDDSNHAGKVKGEIDVATFSFCHEDSIVKDFPNRRDRLESIAWLNDPERDYRFTIRAGDIYNSSLNLPGVLPTLIESYIGDLDRDVSSLKVYLDGRLAMGDWRRELAKR